MVATAVVVGPSTTDPGFHNFSYLSGEDTTQTITNVPNGSFIEPVLQWDEPWGHAETDLDVSLVNTTTGAVLAQDDVLRLHVAVDDARVVGDGQRVEHRQDDVERGPGRQRTLGVEDLAQGLPGDVLHGEEHVPVVLALVVDRDHPGVRQAGRRAGLTVEAGPEGLVLGEVRAHDLERDLDGRVELRRTGHLRESDGLGGRVELVSCDLRSGGLVGLGLRSHDRYSPQSSTVMPMERAVPAMIFEAASMSFAFRSGCLTSAISRT